MQSAIQSLSDSTWSSAAGFFGDFSPILYPLLGLMAFLIVAGAFVGWFQRR